MIFHFLSLILFLIPLSLGTNITLAALEKLDHNTTASLGNITQLKLQNTLKNVTNIVTEGGLSISPLSLPAKNDSHTNFVIYNEHGKNETKSKIAARKGATYYNIAENSDVTLLKPNETDAQKASAVKALLKTIPIVQNQTHYSKNDSQVPIKYNTTTKIKQEKVKIPLKPLVLSATELENVPVVLNDVKLPTVHSSSKSIVTDQMPAPNQKDGPATKIEPMSPSRHPGMVIPVVITILVVPMFGILGYMAVKRGKEAWKNRHYKRMDFLLDGMYND